MMMMMLLLVAVSSLSGVVVVDAAKPPISIKEILTTMCDENENEEEGEAAAEAGTPTTTTIGKCNGRKVRFTVPYDTLIANRNLFMARLSYLINNVDFDDEEEGLLRTCVRGGYR